MTMTMSISAIRPWAAVFALAATLALAACSDDGSSSTTTAKAKKIDACSLLAVAQVEAVVGQPIKPAREGRTAGGGENEGAMTSCHWDADSEALRAPDVTLMVWTWPAGTKGAENYINSFSEAHRQNASIPKPEPVSIGDEAIWDGMGVDVRKGNVNFSLAIVGPDKATARKATVTLARKVLDGL
jgi:hypothetical protein